MLVSETKLKISPDIPGVFIPVTLTGIIVDFGFAAQEEYTEVL
jgi:hypothetical protein